MEMLKNDTYKEEEDYHEALRLATEINRQMADKQCISDDLKERLEQNEQIEILISRLTSKERQQYVFEKFNERDKESDIRNMMLRAEQCRHRLTIKRRTAMLLTAVAVAASVAVLFVFVVNATYKADGEQYAVVEEIRQYSEPTLVLEDGKAISLTDSDISIANGSYEVVITDNCKLKYVAAKGDNVIKYNTLIVPSSFTHSVVLSDGTEVTLNAGSKLIYPTSFFGVQREVELHGEAYFKVAKSDKPFVVKTQNGNVKAYGTEFNVFCGMNDVMEAVLVKGVVGVCFGNQAEVVINPCECISYNKTTNLISNKRVNPDSHLGWMDNKFTFKGQPFERVLYEISTWYGITINGLENPDHIIITMVQDKSCNLSYILDFISDIANVEFINEGKGVYHVK